MLHCRKDKLNSLSGVSDPNLIVLITSKVMMYQSWASWIYCSRGVKNELRDFWQLLVPAGTIIIISHAIMRPHHHPLPTTSSLALHIHCHSWQADWLSIAQSIKFYRAGPVNSAWSSSSLWVSLSFLFYYLSVWADNHTGLTLLVLVAAAHFTS